MFQPLRTTFMIVDLPHCPLPGEILEIAAEERSLVEDVLTFVAEPFQPLREELVAITGLGLDDAGDAEDDALYRVRLSGGGERRDLSVLAAGQSNGQRVIFIHGSPGLGEEWNDFLTRVPAGQFYLAPDRPGFGGSGDEPLTDLESQADALHPLLGSQEQAPVVLVGYSFGGPVALRLAADRPDRVAGLLLIGAAADPALEEIHPLQEVAALDFFADMLPAELASANAELIALRDGLGRLADDLGKLQIPITLVQGTDDTLGPPANVDYLRAALPPTTSAVMIEEGDHFLPWSHPDLLADALDCLLRGIGAQLSSGSGSDR